MRRLVLFLFFVLVSVFLFFNKNNINKNEIYITGTTMGPIVYNIKYVSKDIRINKSDIDSLLILFNNIFSTYQSTSYISILNKSKSVETQSYISRFLAEAFRQAHLYSKRIKNLELYIKGINFSKLKRHLKQK